MMRIRMMMGVAALLVAGSALANPVLFAKYEVVRQTLIAESLPKAQSAAAALAAEAKAAKQTSVVAQATAITSAADLKKARLAFSALSNEMITVRNKAKGQRPAVYYCSMEKKSWLQPKGTVGNPYVAQSMRTCGELKAE